jgi:hypothetical protein
VLWKTLEVSTSHNLKTTVVAMCVIVKSLPVEIMLVSFRVIKGAAPIAGGKFSSLHSWVSLATA